MDCSRLSGYLPATGEVRLSELSFIPAELPADEPERLAALAALDVLDTPAEEELDVITALAADRFDTAIALVSLVDADRQWFKSRFGLAVCETGRAESFCAHTILQDEVLVVLDARADARFRGNPLVVGAPHIRFYAAAPLVTTDGRKVGTLCVIDPRPRSRFTRRDARALMLMARQAMDHLEYRRLRRSQRVAQLIGETTSDAFVCTDAESRIIHWNRAAEQMFGWPADEVLGRTLDLIIPRRHRGAHARGMARLRAGAPTRLVGRTVEVPAIRRDGEELPVELSLGMWTDDGDAGPAGFAAIMRDVRLRKGLEAERESARQRLADQVAAMEAANDGIAITDADGRFVFMNSSHAEMFGFADCVVPLGLHWTDLYPPEEAERLQRDAFPLLGCHGRWRGESRGRHQDGRPIDQEISLSLLENGGIVCVTRDIGERLEAEREKTRLREQLLVAQRQEAVGQLASGIAHDFNNLIAAIAGSATLIEAGSGGDTIRHARRIQAAAAAAGSLVDKLLSLGRRTPERHELDLRVPVTSAAELLRASLPGRHRLITRLPNGPLSAIADGTEVMQVVLNLAINARDAICDCVAGQISIALEPVAAGAPAPPLALGTAPVGPAALIRVEDNGCGIADEDLARIFEPFYTGKADSGTGLGLAMVAGIVMAAGGGIAVQSAKGGGTRFEILWPLDAPAAAAPMRLARPGGGALSGRSVLVVDDEPAVVELLAELLERAGAEVGPCIEPEDALSALADDPHAWALLVTDYDMPGMSGAELASRARAIRPDLPIVLCTALPESRLSDRSFDAITGKPITGDRLIAAVESALASCRSRTCES